jgi:hypothetical protein
MKIRPVIAVAALAFPSLVHAGSLAEDRYGPPAVENARPINGPSERVAAAATAPPPYSGRFLTWSNKAQEERTDRVGPDFSAAARVAPPVSSSVDSAPNRQNEPSPSLYTTPRPAAVSSPPRGATPALADPSSDRPPLAQARPATAPAPSTAPVALAAAAPTAPGGPPARAHFYSLHREYGDQPDKIAIPAERPTVLIGPGDPQPLAGVADEPSDARADKSESAAAF